MEHTMLNGMLVSLSRTPEEHLDPAIAESLLTIIDAPPEEACDFLQKVLTDNDLQPYAQTAIDTAWRMALADADDER